MVITEPFPASFEGDCMSVKVSGLNGILHTMQTLSNADKVNQELAEAVHEGAQQAFAAIESATPERTDAWSENSTSLKRGELKAGLLLRDGRSKAAGSPWSLVQFDKSVAHVARWVDRGHRLVTGGRSRLLSNGLTRGEGREVKFINGTAFFRRAKDGIEPEVQRTVREQITARLKKLRT